MKPSAVVIMLYSPLLIPCCRCYKYHFILNGITTIQNGASATTSRSTLNDGDTITAELTLVSGCVVSKTVTLIENSVTAGTISPANQSICSGATPTIITGVTTPTVNPAANVSYYWQASTDGFATFNNILSNTENYQHPTGITTTTQFRRVDVSELNGKTCSDTTVPVTVSVNAPPVGNLLVNGAAQASLTICTGDTPVFTITGGVASNSYTFRIDTGVVTHTNTPSFDPVALGFVFAPGVTYSVDATIYDKPLVAGNPDPTACTNNTSSITLVVTNTPPVTLTVTGSINNTFCSGEDLTYTATAIVSASYRFKVDGITRQNSVSNTFTVNNITDGQNVNVEITLNSGCIVSTATLTMIENEIFNAGTISGTQQICYNNVPNQLTSVSTATVRYGASDLNYEWYSSNDNVIYNPTGITTLDFQPPALTQTSYFKRVVTSELNNEFCDADSNILIVEVAPELIGGTILPLNDQYLCFDPAAPPILPPASLISN